MQVTVYREVTLGGYLTSGVGQVHRGLTAAKPQPFLFPSLRVSILFCPSLATSPPSVHSPIHEAMWPTKRLWPFPVLLHLFRVRRWLAPCHGLELLESLYDPVDLCPVLYRRFGPIEISIIYCPARHGGFDPKSPSRPCAVPLLHYCRTGFPSRSPVRQRFSREPGCGDWR